MTEIRNAQIVDTFLGFEDHDLFTFMLKVKLEGVVNIRIGCYVVKNTKVIQQIIKVVGVNTWEELKGQYIRVVDDDYLRKPICKIGNILTNKWVDLEEITRNEN